MRITFDHEKDIKNFNKHGISLAAAEHLDWDDALVWFDGREEYGEDREIALGGIGNTLYYCAFVERDDGMRIISLRRAVNKEIEKYVNATKI